VHSVYHTEHALGVKVGRRPERLLNLSRMGIGKIGRSRVALVRTPSDDFLSLRSGELSLD
jgi:hypothetical protein